MGFAEKSHQEIGCKQVTNGLLSGMFVAFQLTFVARHGCAQFLVTGTQCNNVVSKNSLGSKKIHVSLCGATSIYYQLRCSVKERPFGQVTLCKELRCLLWCMF